MTSTVPSSPHPRSPGAMARLAASVGCADYAALHAWSIADLDRFWRTTADFLAVQWHTTPSCALAEPAMPTLAWFPGGTLNYTEHALARAVTEPHAVAVVERSQTRGPVELTWGELADRVHRCAAGLRRLGVGPNDRIGSYCPNIHETLITFLAAAQLGVAWSSCAPEFGPRAVIDRFSQFRPTVLLHVDGYRYGTKEIDRRAEVRSIVAELPDVRLELPVRYLGIGDDGWSALLEADPFAEYHSASYDDVLYVLYSSGTTGLPKPIVHSHVGITLEHLVACSLHLDLRHDDRFFWFTTTGWMMWNLLVSGLLSGCPVVLFDGDPSSPDLLALWNMAEETGTTVFGGAAGFFLNCRKADVHPPRGRIRIVGSTGAPLPKEGFEWITAALGDDVPVNSTSGGTDVCSSFVGGNPLSPVVAGQISASLLGRDAAAFDEQGERCPVGVQGELVITTPMPSMPLGFLGDDDGSRYHRAYFARFPGVWCHGDWITFTPEGGCVISGRSDATLNRGGVRLGSADFYSVVEDLPEATDSLVVHLDDHDRDELYLFVRLADGVALTDEVRGRIRATLRTALSPRHSPDVIEAVPAVPRTLSGKKLEVPVKRILAGEVPSTVLSNESLADPAAIEWYIAYARAQQATSAPPAGSGHGR